MVALKSRLAAKGQNPVTEQEKLTRGLSHPGNVGYKRR